MKIAKLQNTSDNMGKQIEGIAKNKEAIQEL
jgi:hypothetical protein